MFKVHFPTGSFEQKPLKISIEDKDVRIDSNKFLPSAIRKN
jgi:hypothetical protein